MSRPGAQRPGSPLGRRRNHALAVRLLAEGRLTQREIGEACGVAQSTISEFATRNAEEIDRLRHDANVALSQMWIADQAARLRTLQEQAEELERLTELAPPPAFNQRGDMLVGPDGVVLDYATQLNAVRELRATLRAAAEELGQLRPKVDLDGQTLRVEIVGVDLDQL